MKQKSLMGVDSKSFHKIAYNEWGQANPNPIICVHGLSRNSRDFDFLADALAKKNQHVICPDMAGRGESDWLSDYRDYNYPVYFSDITALIARLNVNKVGWIGTSMGGLIGMLLASLPNSPIQYLVMNDVGPYIQLSALKRIKKYIDIGKTMNFANHSEAEIYFRQALATFGHLTDAQWQHIVKYGTRQLKDGKLSLKIDPEINSADRSWRFKDINLWYIWKNVKCPVFVVRGAESDVLSEKTLAMMMATHPQCECVVIPQVGHAPALMDVQQIELISNWIEKQKI